MSLPPTVHGHGGHEQFALEQPVASICHK